jgi:hypothetical protein
LQGLLLYGLDEAGHAAFAEELRSDDRGRLQTVALDRLREWHAVEVWDGPMCVIRLRRRPSGPDGLDKS